MPGTSAKVRIGYQKGNGRSLRTGGSRLKKPTYPTRLWTANIETSATLWGFSCIIDVQS